MEFQNLNFFGLDQEKEALNFKYILCPQENNLFSKPLNSTICCRGVLSSSSFIEYFDPASGRDLSEFGHKTLGELEVNIGNPDLFYQKLSQKISEYQIPVLIGGDSLCLKAVSPEILKIHFAPKDLLKGYNFKNLFVLDSLEDLNTLPSLRNRPVFLSVSMKLFYGQNISPRSFDFPIWLAKAFSKLKGSKELLLSGLALFDHTRDLNEAHHRDFMAAICLRTLICRSARCL